jgi:hypothetical protein
MISVRLSSHYASFAQPSPDASPTLFCGMINGLLDLFFLFAQLSHTAIIQPAFSLFWCLDGSKALRLAPHLDCESDETATARFVACASLGLWGIGFPIALGVLIAMKYESHKYSFSLVSYGYKRPFVYWEAWVCLRRFLVLLLITILRRDLAAFALLVLNVFSAVVLVKCNPFINSLTNIAHTGTDFLVLIILLVGLLSLGDSSEDAKESLSILVIVCVICMLGVLIALIVIEVVSTALPGSKLESVWKRESFTIPDQRAILAKFSSRVLAARFSSRVTLLHSAKLPDRSRTAGVPTEVTPGASSIAFSDTAPGVGPQCLPERNDLAAVAKLTLRIDENHANLECTYIAVDAGQRDVTGDEVGAQSLAAGIEGAAEAIASAGQAPAHMARIPVPWQQTKERLIQALVVTGVPDQNSASWQTMGVQQLAQKLADQILSADTAATEPVLVGATGPSSRIAQGNPHGEMQQAATDLVDQASASVAPLELLESSSRAPNSHTKQLALRALATDPALVQMLADLHGNVATLDVVAAAIAECLSSRQPAR